MKRIVTEDLKPSLQMELECYMEQIEIIDVHEHLPVSDAHRNRDSVDFFKEYSGSYLQGDLVLAGLDLDVYRNQILNPELSISERWNLVEPYWEKCRHTGYARYLDMTVRELYGVSEINRETVETIDAGIRASLDQNWHEEVLKKRCHIKTAINHMPFTRVGTEHLLEYLDQTDHRYFSMVADIVPYIGMYSSRNFQQMEKIYGKPITRLENLKDACEKYLYTAAEKGAVGFKTNMAYYRNMQFDRATFAEADRCFSQILSGETEQQRLCAVKSRDNALENYMMHFALSVIEELKLPLQIHTGLNDAPRGLGNILAEANPEVLIPLFIQYPRLRFDLFHMGFHYQHLLGALGHMYENVYIDLCCGNIISPSAAGNCLSELLEAIPYNKILTFGGDVSILDGVVGHRRMTFRNIAQALTEKVENGLFSERRACEIAKALLYDNPAELYKIGG